MFKQQISTIRSFAIGVLSLASLFVITSISAPTTHAATLTSATGGSAISADTANGMFTSLSGPAIQEQAVGEISIGTIVFNAPAGFVFQTTNNSVTATVSHMGTCSGTGNRLVKLNSDNHQVVTPTTSTITVNVTQKSASNTNNPNCLSTITWSGIAVRPLNSNPLAINQSITKTGTSLITNIIDGVTSFGTLNEIAGVPMAATIQASATNITTGSVVDLAVTVKDAHNNLVADNTPVTVETTLGMVSGSDSTINGMVNRQLTSKAIGTANLTINGLAVSGDTAIQFRPSSLPVIEPHDIVMTEAISALGATVTYVNPSATDEDDPNVTTFCSPASGSVFPIGDTQVTCTATDVNGNQALPVMFTVRVEDMTPPTMSNIPSDMQIEATGPDGATVIFDTPQATDIVDGNVPVQCDPLSGSTLSLGSHTISCIATDTHNNQTKAEFVVDVRDTTPPVVDCDQADGIWHDTDVAIACRASDNASGLDGTDAQFNLTAHLDDGLEDSNVSTESKAVCDHAGNCVIAGPISGNKIDKKAPDIAILSPTDNANYTFRSSIPAQFSCSDHGSDIATCVANVSNGSDIDTGSIGLHTFTVSATDNIGHTTTTSVHYIVLPYGVINILAPLNLDSKTFKTTSTIPVKFQIIDTNNNFVNTALAKLYIGTNPSSLNPAMASGGSNIANMFRYDTSGNQYIFNLSTKNLTTIGTYYLRLVLDDGSSKTLAIQLK